MAQKLYCLSRKSFVSALPEEKVRQGLILHLTKNLQFPQSLILLEKALHEMPHLCLTHQKIPDRRADIVCFAKGIHPEYNLYPLLLIECKAVKLTSKMVNQVIGYNHFVKAYFIAVVNDSQTRFGFYDSISKQYTFIPYIPTFQELLSSI